MIITHFTVFKIPKCIKIFTAGFIHFLLGLSVSHAESCSPAPDLGQWIFVGALMLMATDLAMYPERYMHLPYAIQFLVEVTGCLAILEFFTVVVWCKLESLIHHTIRLMSLSLGMSDDGYLNWEYWLLLFPTAALAGVLFCIMKMAVIPLFDLKSVYRKQVTQVQLDMDVYTDLAIKQKQRLRRQKYILKKS
ncbi:uncharacterized protein LOC128255853 isoform X2 [Drosophila gunungcola]|uniref:uncharacterized protein LOC128255853 isoform X2 n=1 Tax=Drosophila gunungcola TaxID=103775 RepID=UPI0022E85BC7|nr:uncharacterized protein LOC128255853 isoform X2 [Drosophila gunungcola]